MLSKAEKAEMITSVQQHSQLSQDDTGTVEVQVGLLTKRINELTGHFKIHNKDEHSRYGLKQLVNKRRRLLKYLQRLDITRYRKLIEFLGLRH